MKCILSVLFVFISLSSFSQDTINAFWIYEIESQANVDALIALESSKISVNKHPNILNVLEIDSISVQSEYFTKRKMYPTIVQYNISALDANDNVLFTDNPWGVEISIKFKEKFRKCSQCMKVRIDKIRIKWESDTYTLRKRLEWAIKQ